MNAFGSFLLLAFAFIGTLLLIFNPLRALAAAMEGKNSAQIKQDMEDWLAKNKGKVVGKGCSVLFNYLLALVYGFIIEPVAALIAIIREIGNQPLAYAMLAILFWTWIEFVLAFKKKKPQPTKITAITPDGTRIEGEIEKIDEPFTIGNPFIINTKRVIYALPTMYLWYLFLVSIRVL